MTETAARRIVGMSQRLMPLTHHEEQIAAMPGVELRILELWSADDIVQNAADVDILVAGATEPLTAEVLRQLPRLRAIVRRGVGVDNVDVAAATELGIPVAFAPDASVEEVSDHALALALALERRIVQLDRAVHAGRWERGTNELVEIRAPARRLQRLTLGIVGLGRIGRAMARKARTVFGATIGSDPFLSPEAAVDLDIELVGWTDLLARSDVITLHLPATPETRHLIDAAAIDQMSATTTIVNTARGSIVDELALLAAIQEGRLAGAALDVTASEPLAPDDPLLHEPRIILTGHSAASSTAASNDLRRRTAAAVIALLEGRSPEALVDPGVWDRPGFRLRTD